MFLCLPQGDQCSSSYRSDKHRGFFAVIPAASIFRARSKTKSLSIVFLKIFRKFLLLLLFFLLIIQSENLSAKDLDSLPDHLSGLVGKNDAALIADPHGRIIFSKNAEARLIPASTLKIFTALTALHYLGPDYRFTTRFYLDADTNLKLKGYGDPLLISEVFEQIAKTLALKLAPTCKRLNAIIVDDSYFLKPVKIAGIKSSSEPYDAPNGALCANFNTVFFQKNDTGVYTSAEPQTPLLPFALKKIEASGFDKGRIVLSHNENESALYAGHLLKYFLDKNKIKSSGVIRAGKVRENCDKLILTYISEFSMMEIISKLFEHSNNFMANQLFLATGAHVYGPPATLAKGIAAASAYAVQTLDIDNISIVEGSGISRLNRISAKNLFEILKAFKPYHYLMRRKGSEYYKTGTLDKIKTRAGYIKNKKGELYYFVVLVNTQGKSTQNITGRLFQLIN